eukprot:1333694-Pleurochrysis_carterae.AAC.1
MQHIHHIPYLQYTRARRHWCQAWQLYSILVVVERCAHAATQPFLEVEVGELPQHFHAALHVLHALNHFIEKLLWGLAARTNSMLR